MAQIKHSPDQPASKPAIRAGRPPAAHAGEVETRLLDAATHLFLTTGFAATTCDQVVALASAGKASLYARYANKEELFAAVIRRQVQQALRPATEIAAELSLTERLRLVGLEILEQSLQPEALAMMRLVITTAGRFPELAQLAERIGWEAGVTRVASVLSARRPAALEQARPAAALFISLTFAPQQMRALLGDSRATLEASSAARVADAVDLLTRAAWLDPWQ